MKRALVSLGSPGTGKTTRLLEHVRAELERGVRLTEIAIVAFTRAARRELLTRLTALHAIRGREDARWVRTIHSASWELLGQPTVVTAENLGEFAERHAYKLTGLEDPDVDDAPEAPVMRTEDDRALAVYQWGRNRRLGIEQALARCSVRNVRQSRVLRFVERYERYKQKEGLVDFTDLLDAVLSGELRPDVRVAFVDEAQDLSPLQAAVCDMWFGDCARVYIAGDDDQAVYSFQGADASWLQEAAREGTYEVLRQSHRVPARIHTLAERIITRNTRRVPKVYRPMAAAGEIEQWEYRDVARRLSHDVETFVLARNRIHLVPIARELRDRGVPYLLEGRGSYCPLADGRLCSGVSTGFTLLEGDRLSAQAASDLLRYVPSQRTGGLIPWGVKKKLKAASDAVWSGTIDELREEFGLGDLIDAVRERGVLEVMTKVPARVRAYLAKVIQEHDGLPKPRITLTSIHGSKGREAALVVVLSCMTRTTHDAYRHGDVEARESENRVFYVAVTRAKERLVLVRPWVRRTFDMPALQEATA